MVAITSANRCLPNHVVHHSQPECSLKVTRVTHKPFPSDVSKTLGIVKSLEQAGKLRVQQDTHEALGRTAFPTPHTRDTLAQELSDYLPEKWDYLSEENQPCRLEKKEFIENCWVAYQKAFLSKGDMAIGRGNHLQWADLYNKVSNMSERDYLTSGPDKHGNLLKMDRWSTTLNDCWILGGIHRQATFRVVSKIEPKQLLNTNTKQLTVTAREIMGLRHFGYQYEEVGFYKLLKPSALPFQERPSVGDYADHISKQENDVQGSVKSLLQFCNNNDVKS